MKTGSRVVSCEAGRRMFFYLVLLLLLGSCLSKSYEEVKYGSTFKMRLRSDAETVEFRRRHQSDGTVLWRRDGPDQADDGTWRVVGHNFVINKMTEKEAGYYTIKDKDNKRQTQISVDVVAKTEYRELKSDDRLYFKSDMELNSCNIYFIPDGDSEILISRHGRNIDTSYCEGFYSLTVCGISKENPDQTCHGRFEIRNNNDFPAMIVVVDIIPDPFNPIYLIVGGFIVLVIVVCCCVTRCCFGKKESGKNRSNVAVVQYRTYEDEPAAGRSNPISGPSRTVYSAPPSRATTGPLVHSPPTSFEPPSYSEVYPQTQLPAVSTLPLSSDQEPRFEMRGSNFSSPLDTTSYPSDVYNSEKLNFL